MRNTFFIIFLLSIATAFAQRADEGYAAEPRTISAAADTTLRASGLKQFLLGKYYREVWTTPIQAPVLNIERKFGGLKPVELGGGQQTRNVRLMDKDSNIYALRSIPKFPDKALPKKLRFAFFPMLVKDQVSSSMPYGAFTVPPMAEAIGIYHTNPVYYWVPDDPAFGEYKDTISGMLALFEERPEDFRTGIPNLGLTDKWIDSDEIRGERDNSIKHIPDQRLFLKSRYLDMILGDWDRHEGQWNWGVYEKDSFTFYRPVPVDHDNIYFHFEGFLPMLVRREWALAKFQRYKHDLNNVEAYNYNARFTDRYFLNELEWSDWKEIADSVKSNLTDSAVEAGLLRMPDTIYSIKAGFLRPRIISRRDKIPELAREYYEVLARVVQVKGSAAREYFEVQRQEGGQVDVKMYSYENGKKKGPYYSRTFHEDETKEVHLYGEDGDDIFMIEGKGKDNILVRIMGGGGQDTVINKAPVKFLNPNILLYDHPHSFHTTGNMVPRGKISNDTLLNAYDFRKFKRNYTRPIVAVGYNIDEAFYISAGIARKNYRLNPRMPKSEYALTAKYAFGNKNSSLWWNSTNRDILFQKWDFSTGAHILWPEYSLNFFGFGNNEYNKAYGINYYRVPLQQYRTDVELSIPLYKEIHLNISPSIQHTYIKETKNSFINTYLNSEILGGAAELLGGIGAGLSFQSIDNALYPTKGIKIYASANYFEDLQADQLSFTRYAGEVTIYFPIKPLVFALRAGAAANEGTFPFYEGNTLGGNDNLRGYRFNRFYGKSIIYQNTEIRMPIAGMFGVLIFNDIGTVADDLENIEWHRGSGAGIYLSVKDIITISSSYANSAEENLIDVRFGMFF